jgi:hypothetical protein
MIDRHTYSKHAYSCICIFRSYTVQQRCVCTTLVCANSAAVQADAILWPQMCAQHVPAHPREQRIALFNVPKQLLAGALCSRQQFGAVLRQRPACIRQACMTLSVPIICSR